MVSSYHTLCTRFPILSELEIIKHLWYLPLQKNFYHSYIKNSEKELLITEDIDD